MKRKTLQLLEDSWEMHEIAYFYFTAPSPFSHEYLVLYDQSKLNENIIRILSED
jgi:hypothetical protein